MNFNNYKILTFHTKNFNLEKFSLKIKEKVVLTAGYIKDGINLH